MTRGDSTNPPSPSGGPKVPFERRLISTYVPRKRSCDNCSTGRTGGVCTCRPNRGARR